MQFNIDQDTGAAISGWVVPDNPSAVPTLIVSVPGQLDIEVPASLPRPDIRDLGLHATGTVGFYINEEVVPGLQSVSELSIREAASQVLLHHRFDGLPCKVFIFDISMTPAASSSIKVDLGGRFSLAYDGVERYPFDTLFAILNNQFARSIYASGRLTLMRYQNILRVNNFTCLAILRHPFEDLALRLETAEQVARGAIPELPFGSGLAPIIELMRMTDLADLNALQTAMRTLTKDQAEAIANPLVKALACSSDEAPDRRHVALALDNLATMDLVGTYVRFDDFRSSLSEILKEPTLQNYWPEISPVAKEAASVLARMESIRKLLALDLALHSYIEDAFIIAEKEQQQTGSSDRPVL